MVYLTGDIHGESFKITHFSKRFNLTKDDIVVILGDVGCNYYLAKKDKMVKQALSSIPATILCIHGNHEIRPHTIPTYKQKTWNGGVVWYEAEYPNLVFAKDGEIYDLEGKKCIAIGGAYSVDKFYRIQHHYGWWEDEQPSEEIKTYVEKQLTQNRIDYILSHTCPYKYEPRECFLDFIDQSKVDTSTEDWLDKIEETIDYKGWYCGHWHTDKRIDKMHFLFDSFEELK